MFPVFFYLLTTLFIIVSLFMILLVLIQKGRGGGLASAFGGMGGNTAFGSKTGDVLTWATSIVFGIFLLLAIILNLMANHQHSGNTTASASQGTTGSPAAQKLPPVQPPTTAPSAPTTLPVEK